MKATTRVTTYGWFLMVLLGSAFGQHLQACSARRKQRGWKLGFSAAVRRPISHEPMKKTEDVAKRETRPGLQNNAYQ